MTTWWILARKMNLKPLAVVGDYKPFMDYLFENSEEFEGTIEDYLIRDMGRCRLDPGGRAFMDAEQAEFEIDGFKFEVDWYKVSGVLQLMDADTSGLPIMPGYRYLIQSNGPLNYLVALPELLFEKLKAKLRELNISDQALAASFAFEEAREKAEANRGPVRMDKIAQMPPERAIERLEELGLVGEVQGLELLEEDDPADYWKRGD